MEVHHHPKAEKKNFKEYFLEFLMISTLPNRKLKAFIYEYYTEHSKQDI